MKLTSDDILPAFIESGIEECIDECYIDRNDYWEFLLVFAELVAKDEREKCALLCEARGNTFDPWNSENAHNASRKYAYGIRARSFPKRNIFGD